MEERKRNSIGKCFHNSGTKLILDESKYVIDRTREYYMFDLIPMGAVRMTKRDRIFTNPNHADPKKRQRKVVMQYFAYKSALFVLAKQMKFELNEVLDALYLIPMPDSWSEKKKQRMNGLPCKVKPDTDNITKGIKDALKKNDSDIWWEKAEKRWAYNGSIIIFA